MCLTETTILLCFHTLSVDSLVLCQIVITLFTLCTCQCDFNSHNFHLHLKLYDFSLCASKRCMSQDTLCSLITLRFISLALHAVCRLVTSVLFARILHKTLLTNLRIALLFSKIAHKKKASTCVATTRITEPIRKVKQNIDFT